MAASWNLSLAVLLVSAQALVSDEFVRKEAALSGQKSVSVNSFGAFTKDPNGLLRQERLGDSSPTDADTDVAKLLDSDASSPGTETSNNDADLTKLPGSDSKGTKTSNDDVDLTKLLGADSKGYDSADADAKLLGSETDGDADQKKMETPEGVATKAADSDDEMQKLMASFGQTSNANGAAQNTVSSKPFEDFDKEFADVNKDKGQNNDKEQSLESLMATLDKESKDTPDLSKALKSLNDSDNQEDEAQRSKMDALMTSVGSGEKSISDSLTELNHLSPLQTKGPIESSLLQIKDAPDDINLALKADDGTTLNTDDGTKSSDSSDLDTELAKLNSNLKQDKSELKNDPNAEDGLNQMMRDLDADSKDKDDLDKALKAVNEGASNEKIAKATKNVQNSLDELNQLKTPSLDELNQKQTASLLEIDDQPDQAKDSDWLDKALAKIGDGWHIPSHDSGTASLDSSLTQSSQSKDSSWLDRQIKEHMGDNIDPVADKQWLDDELKKRQSKSQDDSIARMAQQQLRNA